MADPIRRVQKGDDQGVIASNPALQYPDAEGHNQGAIAEPDPTELDLILTGLADDIDSFEIVRDLTAGWSAEHKQRVSALLPVELQQKYRALKEEFDNF